MVKDFERAYIYAADQPLVRRIIIMPRRLILINLAASPEANVILLVQEEDC